MPYVINQHFRGSFDKQYGPWNDDRYGLQKAQAKLKELRENAGPGEEFELIEANIQTANPYKQWVKR